MTIRSKTNSDEEFACRLLIEHLTKQGKSGFRCELNSNDPPDLLVTWDDGSQWGVEVTQTFQPVARDGGSDVVSSAPITEPLHRFGQKLKEATKEIRKRDYVLNLGPDPADSLEGRPIGFGRAWKRQTEMAIRQHIEADRTDPLTRTGIRFEPGGLGDRWKVLVTAGVAEMKLTTSVMLGRALEEKTRGLPRWTGRLAERWLLLLSAYLLVDDVREVERTLKKLIQSDPKLRGFDGVFWSGSSDRTLISIPVAVRQ